jgi:2,4-dienoyl-CoA reductase-like NADH-dependent reductase (Old Yellow Enzyme family)/NADPH-dependent 2,4-dienoyl-CoA reductase/sulfur reductase-like enzyme
MTNAQFRSLLAPGRIAGLELGNRVFLPAMDMNLCVEGEISDGEIAHYTARAAGGTAMVITGTGAVAWPIGATSRHQPAFSDDKFIPGIRRLADSIHAVGGKLCMQLCHHGKTASVDTADGRPQLVPSLLEGKPDLSALRDNPMSELMGLATATQGKKATYKIADEDDLAWVIDQFAQAARRVKEAGVDAIEIHAAHGYLLSTFLSRGYNKRDDRWGGSLENRARLTCEVVKAIKVVVGADYPVIVRLNGFEFGLEDGLTPDETARAAALIEEAGADAIHVSANAHNPFADFTQGPLPAEVGQYREYAKIVKQHVTIPVIAVGRMLPEIASEMLQLGECDFVSMGRQLLADPELVNKIREGQRKSVRPCINCYVCVEQNFFDGNPKCAVNPALCNESVAVLSPMTSAKHVVVIGGGPGGMEAARVAAIRGAKVTLIEKGARLGGTMWFSQLTTSANQLLVDWLTHEIERLNIDVLLSTEATREVVHALNPDDIVVATGARRGLPGVPGAELPHVLTGDVLRGLITGEKDADSRSLSSLGKLVVTAGRSLGLLNSADRIRSLSKTWMPVGKRVVVIGGGLVGLELAEFLAERGRLVTVLEEGPHMGLPMAMPRRWTAVNKATKHGVVLVRDAVVVSIDKVSVRYRNGDDEFEVRGDTVVVASQVEPDMSLADSLRDLGIRVQVVGDAMAVGYIEGAMHTAHEVAREL